ncbi:MAG TPA: hypothetical protein PK357_03490 [Candidatus Pacearchaeota archaeon]|nr:hypothetical protein [Candidatus Pacearchaeota archaeon]
MEFEDKDGYEFDFIYGTEQKYIITYKDLIGKECTISGDAFSKLNAGALFKKKFAPDCEILKIQTRDEYIDSVSEEIMNNLIKSISKLESIAGDK